MTCSRPSKLTSIVLQRKTFPAFLGRIMPPYGLRSIQPVAKSALIRGREAILDFFAGIFPALRSVKVVRHYTGGPGWVAAQAEIVLSNGKTLYVLDAFHVQGGE